MKRWLSLLLSITLIFTLAACNKENVSSAQSGDSEAQISVSQSDSEPSESPAESEEPFNQAESTQEAGGTLVAYFSWSGNTAQLAQMIQAETGGDLFEISPATAYTDDYDTLLDVAQQEQADDARPQLADQVENWDSYNVIFVGYPNWWGDAPMLIYSFLESCDWTGKTLIPFCTSGGSAFGRSLDKLPDSASGATILEGLHVSDSRVEGAAGDVAAWIDTLNLS